MLIAGNDAVLGNEHDCHGQFDFWNTRFLESAIHLYKRLSLHHSPIYGFCHCMPRYSSLRDLYNTRCHGQ